MTPDLMNQQTIALSTAFIMLVWRDTILEYLYRHGILIPARQLRPQQPAPFPLHYILPYTATGSTVDQLLLAPEPELQQRRPYHPNSLDKFPLRATPPRRNATPGPSGTRHTPSPPPLPTPEANDRDLWACYDSFLPPTYNPTNLPPPEWALVPIQPCPIMGYPTAPAQRIFIQPPTRQFPHDDNSSEDDPPWNNPTPPANQLPHLYQFITIDSNDEDLDALTPPISEPDVPESVSDTD
ncbi:uncharacterized protein ARMOST_19811 [Armillaria ostoyae]|uniref:Uncharacterized protein n=1 Tax=Armillaria ostoyae TaxID=47428 RepID=A0A284S5K0_ARMOS|nr:uncharacterized protein ARMOST_19811 [Armillaria ostoyae]